MTHQTNNVVTTIARQWNRQAPASVKVGSRTFKPSRSTPSVYDNEKNEITFSLVARKKRGELIATALKVAVTYMTGSDLYRVVVTLVDGASFDMIELANIEGVYADGLATVLTMAARNA